MKRTTCDKCGADAARRKRTMNIYYGWTNEVTKLDLCGECAVELGRLVGDWTPRGEKK